MCALQICEKRLDVAMKQYVGVEFHCDGRWHFNLYQCYEAGTEKCGLEVTVPLDIPLDVYFVS